MAQLLIRQLDDRDIDTLRARAKAGKTSVEAIAREAIRKEARLTVAEKRALVRDMHEWSRRAQVPGMRQTLGVDLIREARDHDD